METWAGRELTTTILPILQITVTKGIVSFVSFPLFLKSDVEMEKLTGR